MEEENDKEGERESLTYDYHIKTHRMWLREGEYELLCCADMF